MEETETYFWIEIKADNALGTIGTISSKNETNEVRTFYNGIKGKRLEDGISQKISTGDTFDYGGSTYTVTDISLYIDNSSSYLTQFITILKVEEI